MTTSKLQIQDLCSIALCTAATAVMAQISIPMPFGVPMTMQTFAVALAAVILGAKKGGISALIYIFLGAAGLPVLSNFTGGLQRFAGPTGGFLISFPVMAFIIGFGAERFKEVKGCFFLCLAGGFLLNYAAGVLFFCLLTGSSAMTGLTACVFPFIPGDIVKAVLAAVLGLRIRGRLGALIHA